MNDDSRVIDKGWDSLPDYDSKAGEVDDAVTVSISTTPGEWLVNTVDSVVVPMSMAEVVEGLQTHKLTERSLVWRAGMQEWAAVERVPQLKLAARLPSVMPPSSAPSRPTNSTKPPAKPARPSSPQVLPAQAVPSRKATLPFGLPEPARPSSARTALPPPPSAEDSEVLAVYDRPIATTSFDLSPVKPLRTKVLTTPLFPQTLAPTTSDSLPRNPSATPRNPDLSVVAASHFRQEQRSSKRLLLVCSLASAVAASLLTLWFSSLNGAARVKAAAPAAEVRPPAVAALPPPVSEPAAPLEVPLPSVSAAPLAAPSVAPAPKPRPKYKARAPRPSRAPEAAPVVTPAEPPAEPNPYDVSLEDESKAKPATGTHGSGLEPDASAREENTNAVPSSPGF